MSRKINHSFQCSNIENLIKTLQKKFVSKDIFHQKLGKINHTNDYDIDFQNSIKYINELSDFKNLPLVAENKNYLINGNFNPDFENENIKRDNNKIYFLNFDALRKKERLKKSQEILKKYKENKNQLTLNNYYPNYDYIKPKIFHAFIRQPNVHIRNSWLINIPFRNSLKNDNLEKKEEDNNINIKREEENTISEYKFKNRSTKHIMKMKMMQNTSSYNDSKMNEKTEESIIFKNLNFFGNKNIKKIKIKKIKALNISFPKINKVRSQINYDKMKGRKLLFYKSQNTIDYSPNYEYILPKTPSFTFKYIPNKENHKKYMNGKIIRGYKVEADSYYVMKFKNNSISV